MSKLWLRPLAPLGLGALQRLVDGPAEHEIAAEDLHRLAHRGPDHRFAEPADGAAERGLPIVGAVLRAFEHLAGQQQREGRGVDERGVRAAELLRPVGPGELVGDQLIGGMRVRNAQQRLGQAHHRDALVRAEVIGVKESVDARRLVRADALDQRAGDRGGFADLLGARAAPGRCARWTTCSSSGR